MRRHHLIVPRLVAGASALLLGLGLCSAAFAQEEKKGPPFADGPDAPKIPPRPELRTWTVVEGKFTFSFNFKPGIPSKGKLVEIVISGLEKPDVPDPKWGSTVPLVGAKLVVEHSSPAGELLNRYKLHPVPLSQGKYGVHLTPSEEGLQNLKLTGRLADGRTVSAKVELPVDVWPLPANLEGAGDEGGAVRRRVIRRPVSK